MVSGQSSEIWAVTALGIALLISTFLSALLMIDQRICKKDSITLARDQVDTLREVTGLLKTLNSQTKVVQQSADVAAERAEENSVKMAEIKKRVEAKVKPVTLSCPPPLIKTETYLTPEDSKKYREGMKGKPK